MRLSRKKHFWFWLTLVFAALTPSAFVFAYLERGYFAVGGEVLFPFIPLLIWMFVKEVEDREESTKCVQEH